MIDVIYAANKIAECELRLCYDKNGIVAGSHHFTDYWARDGFFACLGSLAIADYEVVIGMVDLFFSYQRPDGMLPYRVMNGPVTVGKYFGRSDRYKSPHPTYRLRGFGSEVKDGTILAVMILAKLIRAGKVDEAKYTIMIEKALKYLESKEIEGLLWDGEMSEWNDVVKKRGYLLYTNVLYWNMYRELGKLGKQNDIAKKLRERLWNGRYFADWNDGERRDYFYPFGNLLAIAWGFTGKQESNCILTEAERTKILFTLETNTPKYPSGLVWWVNRLVGMADYQNNGMLWWQPACAYVAALARVGEGDKANSQMKLMARKVVEDEKVWECYERDGRPVRRRWYRAEQPFAWAAGMIVWAKSSI